MTICVENRECLFGEIVDGRMRLSDMGNIVSEEWIKTAEIRSQVNLDEWVVMPNHFHGIVMISRRDTARRVPVVEQFGKPVPGSIPTIIRAFKSAATKHVNESRMTPGAKLWQRNYWEHIIRDEPELIRIREYIRNNPAQWETDTLHPCYRPR